MHGAPPAILTDARPHIGSNLLPQVISSMRQQLEACGVEFRFGARLVDVLVTGEGGARRVAGVRLLELETGQSHELECEHLVLATGHSARDIFELALRMGARLEPKAFALGVRIEHPQNLIDEIQYGRYAGHPKLGPASYRLVRQVGQRGVFSFCMCPGGWIVPAMTDAEHLVVNGMSLSKRDSPYANSGLVVSVEPADFLGAGLSGPLSGLELQRRAERAACRLGGGENRAPASRISDFLQGRASSDLPRSSYLPGLTPADVGASVDATGLDLSSRLREALRAFAAKMPGLDSREGILVGVESRTSSPVRIVRDERSLQSPGIFGLYPAGEGAGYAGGIVSAAVDGLRIADAVVREVHASTLAR